MDEETDLFLKIISLEQKILILEDFVGNLYPQVHFLQNALREHLFSNKNKGK